MTFLSTDARNFHERLQRKYVSQLNSNGIDDVEDYLDGMGLFEDGRVTNREEVRKILASESYPLEIFYRVAPTLNQDVMIATLNPGMQNPIGPSTFTNGEYARQKDVGANVGNKAETVATNLDGFLTNPENRFESLIDTLRTNLDMMEGSGGYQGYVDTTEASSSEGFFGDVCYTWVYKFATPGVDEISEIGGMGKKTARKEFRKEVFDIVQPKVLVSVGKHAWVTLWEHLEDSYSEHPEDLIEAHSNKSPVVKSYHPKLEKGAYSGLYYVKPEDLWVITTWHASMWIKSDRLQNNAKLLNEMLV